MRVTLLRDKGIVLGVTGSIAAFKAADLASKLTQAGAQVDVILTTGAQRFVTPLTFSALTGRAVHSDMWAADADPDGHIAHVRLGEHADLLLIAPASAHTIAKLAHGLADNLLTLTALAARCPLLLAPAMDGGMYHHPATQANLQTLVERGATLIKPDEGRFASGLGGRGRLPEPPELLGHVRRALGRVGALAGRQVVVTAGGTREALDPVRQFGNRSSGKQGHALAQAALDAGAEVTLISSARHLPTPVGATRVAVDTAQEMLEATLAAARAADALIMAAAVADFRPAQRQTQKLRKRGHDEGLRLDLEPTADVLLAVSEQRVQYGRPRFLVGFAAESEQLLQRAAEKLARKKLDLVVANDISAADAGFEVDDNRVTLLAPGRAPEELPLMPKSGVAELVVARVAGALVQRA
ncbi:MAG: bifunctional phosphopantothenoylcysteine decarboxylase/phosphopantothenate--cysteine ligase CoaBC [Anaerolineaceae bacterium]|nr:bifunctional phosphopantothenoylcysteine decarboxylase/phosphopantothenate--cysteine ligase CoaBC [Anaerolineaceae bacterium]MDE0327790.1 bifunctional phosphopantothenoylcysteine decarboxylase/phosphopantothenate--cysteine ligase CoaBC [Anaerolineaceae bacterium]